MGVNISKLECMWLPAQSGKTRKMQEIIRVHQDMGIFGAEENVHVVICSNNRSLVNQTTKRMKDDLYKNDEEDHVVSDAEIKDKVFNWQSGFKKHNITHNEVALELIDGNVEMVVCCAHPKRITYIAELIKRLSKSPKFNKKIMIWIDEADESLRLWSKHEALLCNQIINSVNLVSATFTSVMKKYGRLPVMRQERTHADCYHKFQESNVITEDLLTQNDALSYLKAVYEKYSVLLCVPGIRLFAPGDITQESHNEIAKFLGSKGFAVVVLNGTRKEIIVPGQVKAISLEPYINEDEDAEEIGKQIARFYLTSNLAQFPFAITGHKCIGRGLTFQSADFLFDYGILPYIADKANAYQTVARMLGNIKQFADYKVPTIFMTTKMKNIVIKEENVAINIARMVYDNELQGSDGLVGPADVKQAGGVVVNVDPTQFEWPSKATGGPNYELFDTQAQIVDRMNALNRGAGRFQKNKDEQGFYTMHTGKRGEYKRCTLSDIQSFDKVSSNMPKHPSKLIVGEITQRAYWYYEIGDTDPENCKFALRWIKRISERISEPDI